MAEATVNEKIKNALNKYTPLLKSEWKIASIQSALATLSGGVDNVTVMSSVGSASINNDTLYLDFPVADAENFTFSLNNQTVKGASISGADVNFDNGIANISITGAETFTLNGAEVSAVSITGGAEVNFDNNTALVSIGGGTSGGSSGGGLANISIDGRLAEVDTDTKVASISLSYASENDLDDTGTSIASAGFVNAVIRRLVGNAPKAMDTLGELAAALNNDDDFAATVTNLISNKQDKLNMTNFAANLLKCNSAAELRNYWAGFKDLDFDEGGNSWTAYGSPYMSKTNAKFNKALQLNGSSYLKMNEKITLGATPFTVELFGNYSNSNASFVSLNLGLNDRLHIRVSTESKPFSNALSTDSGQKNFTAETNEVGKLNHYAMSYDGTTLYFFMNGELVGSEAMTITAGEYTVYLGVFYPPDYPNYLSGAISEFRLSNIARYSADFTPPTEPFALDANTISLLHFNG